MLTASLVFAPRLIDADEELCVFVHLAGDVQDARRERQAAFFVQRQRAAGVGPGDDVPGADFAEIARDRRLHEIADETLHVQKVVLPVGEPRWQTARTEIDQRTGPDFQLLGLAPGELAVHGIPIVVPFGGFDVVPDATHGGGAERVEEQVLAGDGRFSVQLAADQRRQLRIPLLPAGERLLGIRPGQAIGRDHRQVQRFASGSAGGVRRLLARGRLGEQPVRFAERVGEIAGNLHSGHFPLRRLIPDLHDLPAGQLHGQQIRLFSFRQRSRADDRAAMVGNRPADAEPALSEDVRRHRT